MIVDNTFLTPVLFRPIEAGADVVIHSGTKYLAGHNDALVGLVVAKGEELCQRLFYIQNGAGAVLSPFDSWLTIRGMKTLALRMERHEQNAKQLAAFLASQLQVKMCYIQIKAVCFLSAYMKHIGLILFESAETNHFC